MASKMASCIENTSESQRIIFELPDGSSDSWSNWSDYSVEDSGNNSESDLSATPGMVINREQASTSTATSRQVLGGRCCKQQTAAQQNPSVQRSVINERFRVQYPKFRGPEHGQV